MSRDLGLLVDILVHARDACGFVAGMGWPAFQESRLHQNAVVRSLEVIGEATGKLTPEFRAAHPETPWSNMVGMRNRLIHDYGEVRLDVVWDVVTQHLPALIEAIEPLVPPPPPPGDLGGGGPQPLPEKGRSQEASQGSTSKPTGRNGGRSAGKDGWER